MFPLWFSLGFLHSSVARATHSKRCIKPKVENTSHTEREERQHSKGYTLTNRQGRKGNIMTTAEFTVNAAFQRLFECSGKEGK